MRADQNFAKRTGECMKDVKPEKGKVRTHPHARSYTPCTPAQLNTPTSSVHRQPLHGTREAPPWHSRSPHLHPDTSHLTPHTRPSPSKAAMSLDEYFSRRAERKATLEATSFLATYLPAENPSGIFSNASCEARNRPQSAVPSSRRIYCGSESRAPR